MPVKRSSGHTLVEVLIAMALGLMIVSAAFSLYRSQRMAYTLAADAARLRDAGHASLMLIVPQIQMAGFAPLDAPTARAAPGLFGCARGRPGGPDANPVCDPLASGSDGLLVRYVGDSFSTWPTAAGQASDCLGQGVGGADAGTLIVNRYYARTSASTGEPELYCEGNGRPGVAQPLVEGVERLRLRYRLHGGDEWMDAALLPAGGWADVVAVELCVQVRGAPTGRPVRYVDCLGRAVAAPDTRPRLVLRRQVAIRNQGRT